MLLSMSIGNSFFGISPLVDLRMGSVMTWGFFFGTVLILEGMRISLTVSGNESGWSVKIDCCGMEVDESTGDQ